MTWPHRLPERLVLDADVIFSRVAFELFGRLANTGAFTILWSDQLLDEAARTLVRGEPTTRAIAARWVGFLRDADGAQRVTPPPIPWEQARELTGDPGDRHVVELVLAAGADTLVTRDAGYSHAAFKARGIAVLTPDHLACSAHDHDSDLTRRVCMQQAASWAGGRSITDLIDAYRRADLAAFADRLSTPHPPEA